MGLDIVAVSNAVEQPCKKDDEFQIWTNNDFPKHCGQFKHSRCYGYDKEFGFKAGSYGGYGAFRDELAKIAEYEPETQNPCAVRRRPYAEGAWASNGGPFWELINFSDCEGIIGTEFSNKLLEDFEYFNKQTKSDETFRFLATYMNFWKAFKLASNNGFVKFT